jgi:hypothetical protein
LKEYLIKNIRASFYLINNNKTKGKMGKITVSQALNIYDDTKVKPNAKEFLNNMSGPMPFGKKLGLLLRNNLHKIRHGKNCCGHPGEPGC